MLFIFVESNVAIDQGSDSYHSPSSSSSLSEFTGSTPLYGPPSSGDEEAIPVDVVVDCEVTIQDGSPNTCTSC